jgi:phosphoserine phosphatase
MNEVIIAFDVDGTILNNEGIQPATPIHLRPRCGVNLEVITLIQILAKKMKNTKIIVWSGGGKEYAEQIVREYGLDKYVHRCYSKPTQAPQHLKVGEYDETIEGKVDICFDDVHSCVLATNNLIVKMK